jgi:hypothetical protein
MALWRVVQGIPLHDRLPFVHRMQEILETPHAAAVDDNAVEPGDVLPRTVFA